MKWLETVLETPAGPQKAVAPEVISASRSTDIPAFYAKWFMNRLRQGYVKWVNPFNQRPQYVSFKNAKVIVFWSKNPKPLMQFLPEIEERRIAYYFHFTLNDYEAENLEPGVPPLSERIATFQALSQRIGKDRVIWRFDPLILTGSITVPMLLEKIKRVGDEIAPFTTKLVFSFADIRPYRKVQNNLRRAGLSYTDFTTETMAEAASGISRLCKDWGIVGSTCAEPTSFAQFGITHNHCIDDTLILRITGNSPDLGRLFGADLSVRKDLFAAPWEPGFPPLKTKDPGQRPECGCVFSKDIGQYNTCPHLCVYCYANTSENLVKRNALSATDSAETIVSNPVPDADPVAD
jgi:hypothetical protein